MVGESLSQVDIITRLMKAGTKTLPALHTIMTGWVGDSQFRILYTTRTAERRKDKSFFNDNDYIVSFCSI